MLPRIGPRNLIIFGSVVMSGGLFWLSTINANSSYLGHLLPCLLIMAFGIGSIFVPLTTVAVAGVEPHEAGLASALLNVGQQVGGSIGLSVLTTVFATASRSEGKHQPRQLLGLGAGRQATADRAAALRAADPAGHRQRQGLAGGADRQHRRPCLPRGARHGSARGFLTAAIFAVVAIAITVTMIKTGRTEAPTPGEEVPIPVV